MMPRNVDRIYQNPHISHRLPPVVKRSLTTRMTVSRQTTHIYMDVWTHTYLGHAIGAFDCQMVDSNRDSWCFVIFEKNAVNMPLRRASSHEKAVTASDETFDI